MKRKHWITRGILGGAALVVVAAALAAGAPRRAAEPPPVAEPVPVPIAEPEPVPVPEPEPVPVVAEPEPEPEPQPQPQPQRPRKPRVDIVFAIDTTGSMGGLIEAAKARVWSIANMVATGQPAPEIRIGLVAYRDVGDEYVTRVYPLTKDLDQVFADLMSFRAAGGGDHPEHVSKALHDAVHGMKWSQDAMKMIFLVGDAPPAERGDGYDWRRAVRQAAARDIAVHAIRAGHDAQTGRVWAEVARRGGGTFTTIDQRGGVVASRTPVDGRLAELNRRLTETTLIYGDERAHARMEGKATALGGAAAPAAADRGAYYARTRARMDADDVLEEVASGRVALEKLDPAKLPAPMREMSREEQRAHVERQKRERDAILKEIADLSRERERHLREAAAAAPPRPAGFDAVVKDAIRTQGEKSGISF